MVIEIELKPPFDEYLEQALGNVESYNVIEMVRIDFQHGIKVGIMEVTMKEGFTIDDLELPPPAKVVSVLQRDGNTSTCVVQVKAPQEMLGLFRQFDLDLVWETPMGLAHGQIVFTVVGENAELRKLVSLIDNIGKVKEIHVQPATFHREDVLASLTKRQREVVVAAKRYGYYDYPRRMNAEELAKRIGISKATVVEHLRKAEGRLLEAILAGY
jgi:predicted DNA binding protein